MRFAKERISAAARFETGTPSSESTTLPVSYSAAISCLGMNKVCSKLFRHTNINSRHIVIEDKIKIYILIFFNQRFNSTHRKLYKYV